MLKVFNDLSDLDFRQLMNVYAEGNQNNGDEFYGKYPENLRLIYAEQDFYNYLVVFFQEPSAKYAVWDHEGVYKAALRIERYCDGILLSALETDPRLRCNGYATKLITETMVYLKSFGSGKFYSHVTKSNHPSLAVHQKCGFRIVSDRAVYLDGTVKTDSYTLALAY